MVIAGFLQVIAVFCVPVLQLLLGALIAEIAARYFTGAEPPRRAVLYCFGLLLHLTFVFVLKLLGLPWAAAVYLPLLPGLLRIRRVRALLRPPQYSLNFSVWFFVVTGLGVSLFQAVNGIETPWANNYGDLTFHLGMISSFVFGNNFPPQYHLFAGDQLSYPFMINLWSASLWWMEPSWKMLAFIFAFQWTLIWCLIFFMLNGNRYRVLPWALLFGGGSAAVLQAYSWTLIKEGQPWTVFLTTLWVTQRSTLLGICSVLAAAHSLFDGMADAEESTERKGRALFQFLLAGAVLGLSPLAHAHFCMVGVGFCLLLLAGRSLQLRAPLLWANLAAMRRGALLRLPLAAGSLLAILAALALVSTRLAKAGAPTPLFSWARLSGTQVQVDALPVLALFKNLLLAAAVLAGVALAAALVVDLRRWLGAFSLPRGRFESERARLYGRGVLVFIAGLIPAMLFLPWLISKSSMVSVMYGWNVPLDVAKPLVQQLAGAGRIWLLQAIWFPALCAAFWLVSRRHLECGALLVLFIAGNVFKLAMWDWDQIKVFVAIYALFLFVWSRQSDSSSYRLHYLCVVLALPGIIEAASIFKAGESYTVFSQEALTQAAAVREKTPADAIVATAPDHNSPVVLSGRKLFMGYVGTLWSHGLAFERRQKMMENLDQVCRCAIDGARGTDIPCPQYLFWTAAEQRYFKRNQPCDNARRLEHPFLYRLE